MAPGSHRAATFDEGKIIQKQRNLVGSSAVKWRLITARAYSTDVVKIRRVNFLKNLFNSVDEMLASFDFWRIY